MEELKKYAFIYQKYAKKLAFFVALACAVAFVKSTPYFWRPEYKTQARLIPPNFKYILTPTYQRHEKLGFGTADLLDLRQIAVALNSDSVFEYMCIRFRLAERYNLSRIKDAEQRARLLRETYDYNVRADVTRRTYIEIEVYDADPVFSAAMTNALVGRVDSFVENLAGRKRGLRFAQATLTSLETLRTKIADENGRLRAKLGLYDVHHLKGILARETATRYFPKKEFHLNYDKALSDEYILRALNFYVSASTGDVAARAEHLRVFPSLVTVAAYAAPTRAFVRPERGFIVAVSGLTALVFGLALALTLEAFYAEKPRT